VPGRRDDHGSEQAAEFVRVSGMYPPGGGSSVAAVMVRKAAVSMARVPHRYQRPGGGPGAGPGRRVPCRPENSPPRST
jgi:hypothetical protein